MSFSENTEWRSAPGDIRQAPRQGIAHLTEAQESHMTALQTLRSVTLVLKERLARRQSGRSWKYVHEDG